MVMKVVLGEFSWQDAVKFQDQDIELEFDGCTFENQKTETLDDYKAIAAKKGKIMAFKFHLPYLQSHYKKIIVNPSAQELLEKYEYIR